MRLVTSNFLLLISICAVCGSIIVPKISYSIDQRGQFGPQTPQRIPSRVRCDRRDFEKCLSKITQVVDKNELSYATTTEDLNTTCSLLKSGIFCADEWMFRCSNDDARNIFQQIVSGSREMVREICHPGPARDAYLRIAPCLKEAIEKKQECSYWQKKLLHHPSSGSGDRDLQSFCCAFQESIKCQIEAVKSHCDQEALQYFQDPMQVRGKEMNQHCLGFTYPPEKCGIVLNRSISTICPLQYVLMCFIIILMMKLKENLSI
ncbi:uncharacterized protein LOC141850246 [Brevipalpus obovatus]|uniref:uncharacterized protein LOC141850246 n=1 Tax=Brevipalpus obovatus TaxID=246614 RepID=UPI003D9EB1BF